MKITRYAQSTIAIEHAGNTVLIDPGNYNFEPGRLDRESFRNVNVLVVTHKHADHFDLPAVKSIYANSRPLVLTVRELAEQMAEAGVPAQVVAVGETVSAAGFVITPVRADHVVRDEVVDAFGVVVEAGGKRVYHTSDTTYFADKPTRIDLVFVPINNRGVAMDFAAAARFVRELAPTIAVPVHYDSPKDNHIDPHAWTALLADDASVDAKVMTFASVLEL